LPVSGAVRPLRVVEHLEKSFSSLSTTNISKLQASRNIQVGVHFILFSLSPTTCSASLHFMKAEGRVSRNNLTKPAAPPHEALLSASANPALFLSVGTFLNLIKVSGSILTARFEQNQNCRFVNGHESVRRIETNEGQWL
jgi:hypothetical protein